ncbi:MAG: hypothetical protein COV72_04155 [Candidatus Omnitrophica bacterium CG11_big_fil_rev_8_21_14_0_20_42_13]|uniref:Rhodanese domain-containing protein n=1 Tax=Candidatus Ghiorseimicrobium undicola TaxID=1974746 RepID=A0A2H0LXQ6_9BACT|nr:MAG: hypothetical protein COV72_04155 [Candidatus Omnitrophica bacterium CG11_big_fil_rev_8_21_14_0_20_42_13]
MKKLTAIGLILCVIFIPACSVNKSEKNKPAQKETAEVSESDSAKKSSAASEKLKNHAHSDRNEQASCPICNIKLFMEKGYKEISTEELEKLQKSVEAFILINVLDFYYYRAEHILNSICIPKEEAERLIPALFNKDAKIILYCRGYHCEFSTEVAQKLAAMGFSKIYDYRGGMDDWKAKGKPVSGLLPRPVPLKKTTP